jgi:hypothetical protein
VSRRATPQRPTRSIFTRRSSPVDLHPSIFTAISSSGANRSPTPVDLHPSIFTRRSSPVDLHPSIFTRRSSLVDLQ